MRGLVSVPRHDVVCAQEHSVEHTRWCGGREAWCTRCFKVSMACHGVDNAYGPHDALRHAQPPSGMHTAL